MGWTMTTLVCLSYIIGILDNPKIGQPLYIGLLIGIIILRLES